MFTDGRGAEAVVCYGSSEGPVDFAVRDQDENNVFFEFNAAVHIFIVRQKSCWGQVLVVSPHF